MTEMFFDLHLTSRCNLSCKHCYLDEEPSDMSYDMFTSIIDNIFALEHPIKERGIIFSGGEPTMHSMISEFITYVHDEYNQHIKMPTNGFRIPELVDSGIFHSDDGIQISVDGNKQTHDWLRGEGSYDQALKALDALDNANIKHGIHFTVHQENVNSIYDVMDVAKNTNCDWMNVNWYHDINYSVLKPVSREVFEILRNGVGLIYGKPPELCYFNGCIAGILGMSVLPDGTYWDCSRSQKVLGHYPQKIEKCLYWQNINNKQMINPVLTCMKVK